MRKKVVKEGSLHRIPADMTLSLTTPSGAHTAWQDITPLAKNEWICWVTSAVKPETRERRIRIMKEQLLAGKRRPCCWAGCPHR